MSIIENILLSIGVLVLAISTIYLILEYIIDIIIDSKKINGERIINTNTKDEKTYEIKHKISPKLMNFKKLLNKNSIYAKLGLFIGIGLVGVHLGKISITMVNETLNNIRSFK